MFLYHLQMSYGLMKSGAEAFAFETGLSVRQVRNWLRGKSGPAVPGFIVLMAAFPEMEEDVLRRVYELRPHIMKKRAKRLARIAAARDYLTKRELAERGDDRRVDRNQIPNSETGC